MVCNTDFSLNRLVVITVIDTNFKETKEGKFGSSLVRITPINLNKICGRRLRLENCAIDEFKK